MKKRWFVPVVAALAVLSVVPGWGQSRPPGDECEYALREAYLQVNLEQVEEGYLQSLSHSVPGVVDCALGEIARIKVTHLTWDSPAIREKLEELSREGITRGIRYKASLVSSLFDSPTLFVEESMVDFRTPKQLYRALAHRLEEDLLAGS